MQTQAPWTEIGRLQSDVSDIKRQLNNKADSNEMHEISRKLDSLERSLRQVSSDTDELRCRVEDAENKIRDVESRIGD